MGGFSFLKSRGARDKEAAAKKDESRRKREQLREERNEWRTIGKNVRAFAAHRYIKGTGIEIGGLHRPLKVYHGAKVKYVDRLSTEEVRKFYSNVADQSQVTVDIVDDGETLRTIADESFDFVIANHMIEHTRNPLGTIQNFLRVLKPGGVIYMAVPDKRFTFDIERPVTPYEHIKRDFLEGPDWSDREHYEEWTKFIAKTPDEESRNERVELFHKEGVNIHFHVWTQREIIEMFLNVQRDLNFPLEIEAIIQNGHEVVCVLRKTSAPA